MGPSDIPKEATWAAWLELVDKAHNHDKFWCVYVAPAAGLGLQGYDLVKVCGRNGSQGQRQTLAYSHRTSAEQEAEQQVYAKVGKGYGKVPLAGFSGGLGHRLQPIMPLPKPNPNSHPILMVPAEYTHTIKLEQPFGSISHFCELRALHECTTSLCDCACVQCREWRGEPVQAKAKGPKVVGAVVTKYACPRGHYSYDASGIGLVPSYCPKCGTKLTAGGTAVAAAPSPERFIDLDEED